MRLYDGRYECALCGARLDIPLVEDPHVMIRAASGTPPVRSLILNGEVIHECKLGPDSHERLRVNAAALRAQAADLRVQAQAACGQTDAP